MRPPWPPRHRLSRSYPAAKAFVAMFNSEALTIVSRFATFLFGGLLVVLVLFGVIFDEEFFFADLTPHRSVSWWIGILGVLVAVTRGLIPDQHLVISPAKQLRLVATQTHYMPPAWVDHEGSVDTYQDFSFLFQYQAVRACPPPARPPARPAGQWLTTLA